MQLASYEGERLHLFSSYFLPYLGSNFEGLVSTISDEPSQLNWIYLDTGSKIFQISHELRAEAEEGLTGPWGARVMERYVSSWRTGRALSLLSLKNRGCGTSV